MTMKTEAQKEKIQQEERQRAESELLRLQGEIEDLRSTTNATVVPHHASLSENGFDTLKEDNLVIEKIREEEASKFSQQLQEVIQEKDSVIDSLQRKISENMEKTSKEIGFLKEEADRRLEAVKKEMLNQASSHIPSDTEISKVREQVAAEYEAKINDMKQAIKGKLLAKIKEVKDEAAKSNQAEIKRMKAEMKAKIIEEVSTAKVNWERSHKEELQRATDEAEQLGQQKEMISQAEAEERIQVLQKELEDVKATSEGQLQQKLEELREEMQLAHCEELKRLKGEAQRQLEKETGQLKLEMEAQCERQRNDKSIEISEIKVQLQQTEENLEATKLENAQRIKTAEEIVLATQAEHEKGIDDLKKSLEKKYNLEQQKMREEFRDIIAVYEAKVDGLEREKVEALEKLRLTLDEELKAEVEHLHKHYQSIHDEDISRLRSEMTSSHETEIQKLHSSLQAECNTKINDVRKTLAEEHNIELQAVRSEMLSSCEEKLKLVSSNADLLQVQELARIRKEMADDAEQTMKSLKEHYETKMQAELEQHKSKSFSENESQLAIQALKAEYEAKMDDLRLSLAEEHKCELQRIRADFLLQQKDEMNSLIADHENKVNELRRTLAEENKALRLELISSYEEKMQLSALDSAKLHAKELDQVRKVTEQNAEKNLLLFKEDYESKMQAELERLRSEFSSSTESESQDVSKLKVEHEAKMEEIRILLAKENLKEKQRIREEMLTLHQEELQNVVAEYDGRMNDLRKTLTQEHDTYLEQVRSEMISTYEAKIKSNELETAELHAQELIQVRKQMADDAEKNLLSLKERYKSELQEDLKHMKTELSRASEKELQLLQQGLEADYESRVDDLRHLLTKEHSAEVQKIREDILSVNAEELKQIASKAAEKHSNELEKVRKNFTHDAEVKLAAMRAEHDSAMQAETKRIRVEAQITLEHELKQLREVMLAECEEKIELSRQSLAEEHSIELERVRSDMLLEHAEHLRLAEMEATKLHAKDLELMKQEAADDAERTLKSVRENFENNLKSELDRVRSEVRSLSEAEMQRACHQVTIEYETKIESLKKMHEKELQNVRLVNEEDKAQLAEESADKISLAKEEWSNEAAQKLQEVTDRLNIEWKAKLEDALNCQQSKLENDHKLYKENVSKYVKDLKSKTESKDSEISGIQSALHTCQKDKDQLLEAKQKLEAEMKAQRMELEKCAGEYIEEVKSLEQSRELLKQELENANKTVESLRKNIEKIQEELNNRHAELLLLSQNLNAEKEDYEVVLATMKAEHEHEICQLKEELKKVDEVKRNEVAYLQSQLDEKIMEVEAMTNSFDKEKSLVRSEAESACYENIEKLKADCDAEKSKVEAISRTVEDQKSVISKLEEEKRAIIEKAKAAFTKQLKSLKEQNSSKISSLEESIELEKLSATDRLKQLTESHKAEIEELKSSHAKLMSECETKLCSEIDFLREKMRDQMSYQEKLEGKVKSLTLEIEEASSTNIASITAMRESCNQAEQEKKNLDKELSGLKTKLSSSENQVDELLQKVDSLTVALNSMADTQKKNEDLTESARKQEEKLAVLQKQLSVLQEEGNKLKLEQVQSSGLVARLQAEKDATERKYGQRTALIGMLEAQISELKALNEENKLKLKEMIEVLRKKDDDLRALSRDLERVQAEADSNQHIVESSAMKHLMAERDSQVILSLQSELQSVQQQMARKSAAAQNLLRQKEVECEKLNEALKKLQKDFDRVGLSDRRIFEIAEKQSNRDSAMSAEIDIRDKLMDKMKDALVDRDGDLASAEYDVKQKEDLLAELGRVQRREDVNLDYLKSTIVQFLSKPPGSSERAALLPVIATLLQVSLFDARNIRLAFGDTYLINFAKISFYLSYLH